MKRALVTGAGGFLGANLVRRLCEKGHEVHCVLRPGPLSWRLKDIESRVRVHPVDLADRNGLFETVRAVRPEWIFHLAAHGAYSHQMETLPMIQTNVAGTTNLVEACLETGFQTFVNTGSSSEYGFKDHAPSEEEALEPNSCYAVTKAAASYFCRYTARSRKVRIPTLRLYSAYGPWEEPRRLIPTLVLHALRGQWPPLADPTISRDFVYTEDVTDAFLKLADAKLDDPGAIFNVGTGIQTSLRDLVECVGRLLDVRQLPKWGGMANRNWDTSCWVASNLKIMSELGWSPKFNLNKGLQTTVEWFKTHPHLQTHYEEIIFG